MRYFRLLGKLLAFCCLVMASYGLASAQVSVSVSSPANGATVGTTFTVNASGSSPNGMDGWYIYADGNAVWNTPGPTSSIAATLTLSTGTHSLLVRGWDQTGAYASASLSVNVSTSVSSGGSTGATSSSGVTVTLNSPGNGATVASPVNVAASATSPNGISGWVVYMDGQNVYQVNNNSNSLSAQVSMPTGSHSVVVKAWDQVSGSGASPTANITVSSSTSTGSTSTAPSGSVTLSRIEESDTSTWGQCSDCAGPLNISPDFWTANFQTSPSLDGASRQFFVGGAPWTAALFYHKVNTSSGQYDYASHFIWDFWVYVDSASLDNVWTFEFDLYQAISGWEYMIGSHCSIGDGFWYGWNQANGNWVQLSNAPCRKTDWTPGVWHHVVWTLERIPGTHNYKYDSLQLDSNVYTINMTQPASPINWSDVLGIQYQVDTNSNGGGVHWWIDKVKLTVW